MKPHTKQSWDSLLQAGGVIPARSATFQYSKYGEHYGKHGSDETQHNMPIMGTQLFNQIAPYTWG